MAAILLESLISKAGLSGKWTAESAGLHCLCGSRAAPEAHAATAELGLDLSPHRSRPVTDNLAARAYAVLTMTEGQRLEFIRRFPFARDKVRRLGDFAGGAGRDIEDPFGGSLKVYRNCLREISACAEGVIKFLKEESEE